MDDVNRRVTLTTIMEEAQVPAPPCPPFRPRVCARPCRLASLLVSERVRAQRNKDARQYCLLTPHNLSALKEFPDT